MWEAGSCNFRLSFSAEAKAVLFPPHNTPSGAFTGNPEEWRDGKTRPSFQELGEGGPSTARHDCPAVAPDWFQACPVPLQPDLLPVSMEHQKDFCPTRTFACPVLSLFILRMQSQPVTARSSSFVLTMGIFGGLSLDCTVAGLRGQVARQGDPLKARRWWPRVQHSEVLPQPPLLSTW